MIKIFRKDYPITSGYRTPERPDHNGIDYGTPIGVEVLAPEAGTAVASTDQYGGLYIQLNTPNQYWHFVHLSKFGKQGTVNKGDIIGYSGNSGNSTGPHTHVGLFQNGKDIDPTPYLYDDPYARIAKERPDVTDPEAWWGDLGSYEFMQAISELDLFSYEDLRMKMNAQSLLDLYNSLPNSINVWAMLKTLVDARTAIKSTK